MARLGYDWGRRQGRGLDLGVPATMRFRYRRGRALTFSPYRVQANVSWGGGGRFPTSSDSRPMFDLPIL